MGLRCLCGMGVISLFLIVQLKRKLSPIPWMGEGTMYEHSSHKSKGDGLHVFSSFSLILAKFPPQPFLASYGQPRGGGGGGGQPAARNTPFRRHCG